MCGDLSIVVLSGPEIERCWIYPVPARQLVSAPLAVRGACIQRRWCATKLRLRFPVPKRCTILLGPFTQFVFLYSLIQISRQTVCDVYEAGDHEFRHGIHAKPNQVARVEGGICF